MNVFLIKIKSKKIILATKYLFKVNDKHCLEEDGLEAQF